ncbi:MAG: FecR family protein [Runella sp.]
MRKQSFEHLLDKYLRGECTPEERQLVEQWYELIGRDILPPQNETEWQNLKAEIWDKIKHITSSIELLSKSKKLTSISKPSYYTFQPSFYSWLAAASVVLAIALGYWYLTGSNDVIEQQIIKFEKKNKIEWQNRTEIATVVKLEDGTRVRLQPKASISVPENFSDTLREIVLTGDAFFDVVPDQSRPFIVRVGNIITRVLGTSFWVLNRANKKVEIEVKTGKVSVFERNTKNSTTNGVVLTPNHKVTYFADERHFVTGIVEKPEIIKHNDASTVSFLFNESPLSEVIASLERGYGINIELANESLKSCTLTGDLETLEMYDKLKVICQTLGANYEVQGTSILINGKGCQ